MQLEAGIEHATYSGRATVTEYCPECPLVEVIVPPNASEVVEIKVKTISNDQGWSDSGITWTWFDILIASESRPVDHRVTLNWPDSRRLTLVDNDCANPKPQVRTTILSLESSDDKTCAWLRSIRPGDRIQVVARAKFAFWINIVHHVDLQVSWRKKAASTDERLLPGTQLPTIAPELNIPPSVYTPLDKAQQNIRVLSILPGKWDDPLVCSLAHACISKPDETIPYTALSYCWGADDRVAAMTLQTLTTDSDSSGVSITEKTTEFKEHVIHIKLNLHTALKYIRSETAGELRVVWVDALCINQRDTQERNQQVAIMQHIYSCAKDVCIWLGEESEKAGAAVELLQPFVMLYESDKQAFLEKPTPHVDTPHSQPGMHAEKYREVGVLFQSAWFSRIWVLQEVFNAKAAIVRVGNKTLPWDILFRIGACIRKAREKTRVTDLTLPDIFFSLFGTSTTRSTSDASLSGVTLIKQRLGDDLLSLLMSGLDLDATDARDKIFALLPIWRESTPLSNADVEEIRPDYSKKTRQVFTQLTRWWIRTYQSLRILSTVHATLGRTWQRMTPELFPELPEGRPSWAMWHTGRSAWVRQGTLAYDLDCPYKASGTVVDEMKLFDTEAGGFGNTDNVLPLQGIEIGRIGDIRHFPWSDDSSPASDEMQDAFDKVFDPAGVSGTWNPAGNIAGPEGPNKENQIRVHIKCHEGYDHWHGGAVSCISPCYFSGSSSRADAIGGEVSGLCPHGTRVGDIVVVLVGGNVPYVLREISKTAGSVHYGLVGECFVEDYMHGLAIKEWRDGALQMQTFELI